MENCEYLGECETKFENILGGFSGAHMELFYEKNGDEKSRDTVPLRAQLPFANWALGFQIAFCFCSRTFLKLTH